MTRLELLAEAMAERFPPALEVEREAIRTVPAPRLVLRERTDVEIAHDLAVANFRARALYRTQQAEARTAARVAAARRILRRTG